MRFDLHKLDREVGAEFVYRDAERQESMSVVIPALRWDRMGRPTHLEGGFSAPGSGWFVELNANDDPTIYEIGDEPVLSRSDMPAHWDELVARLGIAP